MKIILHIGQPKTGTTSLQNSLYEASGTLAQAGVLYPVIDLNRPQHIFLPALILKNAFTVSPLTRRRLGADSPGQMIEIAEDCWRQVKDLARQSDARLVVLSSELLSRNLVTYAGRSVRALLAELSDDVQPVIYVRNPADHYLSVLQQQLKVNGQPLRPSPTTIRAVIQSYEAEFGRPVQAELFHPSALRDGDIVRDFAAKFLPAEIGADTLPSLRTNESISAEAMDILAACGKGQPEQFDTEAHASWEKLRRIVIRIDKRIDGAGKPRLKAAVRDAIIGASGDINWVAERFGIEFPGVDRSAIGGAFPDEIAGLDVPDIIEVDPDRRHILARRVARKLGEEGVTIDLGGGIVSRAAPVAPAAPAAPAAPVAPAAPAAAAAAAAPKPRPRPRKAPTGDGPEVIVHFGSAKTGTTALQTSLAASRAKLKQHGVLYPEAGEGEAHHLLAALFKEPEVLHPYLLTVYGDAEAMRERAEAAWSAIVRQVKSEKPHTVILSSEFFFGRLTPQAMERFAERLDELGGRVTPVVYVRDPADWLLSQRQQSTKSSGTLASLRVASVRPTITLIEDALDVPMVVRGFDRSLLEGGDIVTDFATHALAGRVQSDWLVSETQNESLSPEAMDLMQTFHKLRSPQEKWNYGGAAKVLRDRIAVAEAMLGGPVRPKLKPAWRKAIYRQATDLIWLRDTYGIVFPKVDYGIAGTADGAFEDWDGRIGSLVDFDAERRDAIVMHVIGDLIDETQQNKPWLAGLRFGGWATARRRLGWLLRPLLPRS